MTLRLVGLFAILATLVTCGARSNDTYEGNVPAGIGPVCGNANILGEMIDPIDSARHAACGIDRPVRIFAVSGVTMSQRPVMNCKAAQSLNRWVGAGMKPALANQGGGLKSLRVAAHYSCRTRNSQRGARISEHGKGNAIDVSAFRLENGDLVSVLEDWGKGRKGRALKAIRKSACGPFGVVLGPGSDRFHRDHFHADISHLNNRYCK